MQIRPRFAALAASVIVAAALVPAAPSASARTTASDPGTLVPGEPVRPIAPDEVAPLFREVPGELAFSGRMLVQPVPAAEHVRAGADPAAAAVRDARARARLAPLVVAHEPGPDLYVVDVPAGSDENAFGRELLATGDYAVVHPDWICAPAGEPNDPLYGNQWHHAMIDSETAWAFGTGSSSITVGIVDTGVDLDHPDLVDHLVPGYNSVDRVAQVDGGNVNDVNGHGSLVSGTTAAVGDNATGVAGVAWDLRIMPIRTSNLGSGNASMSNILHGAVWAIENGARIANASYSGVSNGAVSAAGDYIRALGGILVFAAGNSSTNHANWDWDGVVVVGATNPSDDRAGFSSFGRGVDLFAPGVDILSTENGGGYASPNGTSFSAPMVAGCLALLWSVQPERTADEIEYVLFQTCDDKGDPGEDDEWGHGRANIGAAMTLLDDPDPSMLPPDAGPDRATVLDEETRTIDVLANDFDFAGTDLAIVDFDAESDAGGAITLVLGAGPDGRDLLHFAPAADFNGADGFSYTVRNEAGLEDTARVVVSVVDADFFLDPVSPVNPLPGLRADYYALDDPGFLPDFADLEPYAAEVLPRVDEDSGDGPFAGSGRDGDLGVVLEGYLEVDESAQYLFTILHDDGVRLSVGDRTVVSSIFPVANGPKLSAGGVGLVTGTHPVRIEYFRGEGPGMLQVAFAAGAGEQEIVDDARWSRERTCRADATNDLVVDEADLAAVFAAWGDCPAAGICLEDLDGDGRVGIGDVVLVVTDWGGCD